MTWVEKKKFSLEGGSSTLIPAPISRTELTIKTEIF